MDFTVVCLIQFKVYSKGIYHVTPLIAIQRRLQFTFPWHNYGLNYRNLCWL